MHPEALLGSCSQGVGPSLPGGVKKIGYMSDQNSSYGLRSLPGGDRLVTWSTLAVVNGTVFCGLQN
jgi:hypothetical protein